MKLTLTERGLHGNSNNRKQKGFGKAGGDNREEPGSIL